MTTSGNDSAAGGISLRRYGSTGRILVREASTILATFFGLLVVTFLIGRVVPIDPVLAVVGENAPADVYENLWTPPGRDEHLAALGIGCVNLSGLSLERPRSWP